MLHGDGDSVPSGHLYILMDGKVHSYTEKMSKPFTDTKGNMLSRSKKQIYAITTEHSERSTRALVRGIGAIPTVEFITLVSRDNIVLPTKDRLHSAGTNSSDMIGPFTKPLPSAGWQVRHKSKVRMYGSAMVDPSGKVEGDA